MAEVFDYDALADAFSQNLLVTLRKHGSAHAFLDHWVPDADPVLGIAGMVDAAKIAGMPSICIRVSEETIGERGQDLAAALAELGSVTTNHVLDAHAIEVTVGLVLVRGIVLPANTPSAAGAPFYEAPPPSEAWTTLSKGEREARIANLLGDVRLIRLEKNRDGHEVRVIVAFSGEPRRLRQMEALLRRETGVAIELLCERAKDLSPLRRVIEGTTG